MVTNVSLNVEKTKFMIFFHKCQRVIANEVILDLKINDKNIGLMLQSSECNDNRIHEWSSHSAKIVNTVSCTLGIMKRKKGYFAYSAMKLVYDSFFFISTAIWNYMLGGGG